MTLAIPVASIAAFVLGMAFTGWLALVGATIRSGGVWYAAIWYGSIAFIFSAVALGPIAVGAAL